jgi:polyhydroxybutyrate depolymerase
MAACAAPIEPAAGDRPAGGDGTERAAAPPAAPPRGGAAADAAAAAREPAAAIDSGVGRPEPRPPADAAGPPAVAPADAAARIDARSAADGPASEAGPAAPPSSRPPPGTRSAGCGTATPPAAGVHTVQAGAQAVRYHLHLPEAYDPGTAYRLVFGFHGGHGDATTTPNTPAFRAAFGGKALLAFPEMPNGMTWINDPRAELGYFDAIMNDIAARFCVDLGRVHAAGYSAGGFFSGFLACERAHVVSAVAPVGSRMATKGRSDWILPGSTACRGRAAAIVIHGTNDDAHPGETDIARARALRDHFVRNNACGAAPPAESSPRPCVAYAACAEPVRYCEFAGDHVWPPFANEAIAGFFLGL